MCLENGEFKLCTCGGSIDRSKPHWVLRKNVLPDNHKVMKMGESYLIYYKRSDMSFQELVLEQLNREDVFDFDYNPRPGDLLELYFPKEPFMVFKFRGGSWKKLKSTEHSDNLKSFQEDMEGYFVQ